MGGVGGGGGGGGDIGRPTTPMSSSTGSGVPPTFDAAELGAYARESREVSFSFCFISFGFGFWCGRSVFPFLGLGSPFAPEPYLHFNVRI
jgi:hypothetical protein